MKKLLVALLIPTVCFAQTFKQRDINGYVYDFEVSTVDSNSCRQVHDVYIQDQTTENISLFLGYHLATNITIVTNAVEYNEALYIDSPTVVPAAGNYICAKEGANFAQIELASVSNTAGTVYYVTTSMPLDYSFTSNALVCLQDCDLAYDGSTTNRAYYVTPEGLTSGNTWDVTRMIVSMVHSAAGDDGKFGGISAIANGVYFRIEDGNDKNLFNAKENSDFAMEGYDIAYPTRSSPLGNYGTRSRITFSGQEKRGVVIRLSGDSGDKFKAVVRDDLSGLGSFRVKVQGHVVE